MYDIEVQSQHTPRLYPAGETIGYATVQMPETWVYTAADSQAFDLNQYTYGEPLRLLEQSGGFTRVQSLRDSYSGWVRTEALSLCNNEPPPAKYRTICIAPVTKNPGKPGNILCALPPDACVIPVDKANGYVLIANLGWIHRKHLQRFDQHNDIVLSARNHLGRSYVPGGRGVAGLDSAALCQLCYREAGFNIPRHSDLQEQYLKSRHKSVELCELVRGDLLFLPQDKAMIVADAYTVIHASAFHMRVVIEDLKTVLRRAQEQFGADVRAHAYRWHDAKPYVHIF